MLGDRLSVAVKNEPATDTVLSMAGRILFSDIIYLYHVV